jgi:antitoxin (DNA-binding transcriptional repressor) of toxin-antitoxin stability system
MMRLNPSVTEVARHFADYINRVAFRGERFTLMRGNKPVAELRPVPAGRRLGELPDLLASLPRLSPEDTAAFGDDLEAARRELAEVPLRDPWAS